MDPDHRPSYVCAYVNPGCRRDQLLGGLPRLRSLQDGSPVPTRVMGPAQRGTLLVLAEARITAPEHGFHQGTTTIALVDTHHVRDWPIDPVNIVEIIDRRPAARHRRVSQRRYRERGRRARGDAARRALPPARPAASSRRSRSSQRRNRLQYAELCRPVVKQERDREALGSLALLADLPDEFVRRMFLALCDFAHRGTGEVLAESYKQFQAGGVRLRRLQVETVEARPSWATGTPKLCLEQVTARTRLGVPLGN